jgi:PIN domain nuclease of toxin-antitoxin system
MILLDTHVLFWMRAVPKKLSRNATRVIERAASAGTLAVSCISLWELAWLVENERLRLKTTTTRRFLEAMVQTPGLLVLPITTEVAAFAAQLPRGFPGDPCDRIIAATAIAHGATLVTKDVRIEDSAVVPTIW